MITEHLLRRHGPGPLAVLDEEDLAARNMVTVIDGALDALINALYLQRDGVGKGQASYVAKQHERAAAALGWVEARVDDVWLARARAFGLPELALVTALEWMRFRDMYPVERHPALVLQVVHHSRQVRHALRLRQPKSFLHVENVDSEGLAGVVAQLVRVLPGCAVALSGRYALLGEAAGWPRVQVRPLSPELALAQLRAELGAKYRPADEPHYRVLVQKLHNLEVQH